MEQKELNDKLTEYKNIGSIKEIKEVFIKSVECINNNKLLMNDIKKLSDSNSLLYIEVERLKTELAETNTKARELVELNLNNEMLIVELKQQLAEKDKQLQNAVFPKFKVEEELASQNFNELVKKKYDSLKEAIKFLWGKQITDEHIFYVIDQLGQQHIDRIQDIENGICEIERLEKELAELKQNAIVPKFDANDKVYHIVYDEENSYYKIESRKIILDKYYLLLTDKSPYILYKKENELFSTLAEAEEALKKMEESNA